MATLMLCKMKYPQGLSVKLYHNADVLVQYLI